jgi:hypothetical protein
MLLPCQSGMLRTEQRISKQFSNSLYSPCFLGDLDFIESNRNQSLIGLNLFPPACAIRGHHTNPKV